MFYAKCEGICSPVTRNLVRVQRLLGDRLGKDRIGKDVFIYSFSLKPKEDNVAALKHYADMHKVGPGWLFLTGKPDDMELLRRKLGFVDPDPELDKDLSNTATKLLNDGAVVRDGKRLTQLRRLSVGWIGPETLQALRRREVQNDCQSESF
jgi:cytochrome oxidase Cu insertion factor (SCO1/SenC/PrrC family)